MDDSPRVTAQEFGQWVKNLPGLLSPGANSKRTPRAPAVRHDDDHPLGGSMPPSHRPSSRNSSYSSIVRPIAIRAPAVHELSLLEPTLEQSMDDLSVFYDPDLDADERPEFDSTGQKVVSPVRVSTIIACAITDTILQPLPTMTRFSALTSSLRSDKSNGTIRVPPSPTSATTPTVTKKSSIWRLGFGKSSTGPTDRLSPASASPAAPVTSSVTADNTNMSPTASNVTNLIMGLNPVDQPSSRGTTFSKGRQPKRPAIHSNNSKGRSTQDVDNCMTPAYWAGPKAQPARGEAVSSANSLKSGNWRSSMSSNSSLATSNSGFTRFSNNSARSVATAATSVSASSWRSGAGTGGKGSSLSPPQQRTITPATLPRNIKREYFLFALVAPTRPDNYQVVKNGVPFEASDLRASAEDEDSKREIYGSPPLRQPRFRLQRENSSNLHTITERPRGLSNLPNEDLTKNRGHMDLTEPLSDDGFDDDADGRKKVQKGQINALAKMLSALRR